MTWTAWLQRGTVPSRRPACGGGASAALLGLDVGLRLRLRPRALHPHHRRCAWLGPRSGSALLDKRQLIQWVEATAARTTGRRYQVRWDALDVGSLRELQRLLRDLETKRQRAVQQARLMPWRLP